MQDDKSAAFLQFSCQMPVLLLGGTRGSLEFPFGDARGDVGGDSRGFGVVPAASQSCKVISQGLSFSISQEIC